MNRFFSSLLPVLRMLLSRRRWSRPHLFPATACAPAVLLTAVMAALVAAPVRAQDCFPPLPGPGTPMPAPRPWRSLDPAQRSVLLPLRDKWDTLPPRRQSSLLLRSEQWVTLPPEQREEVRQHIARWETMTPEERQQARANMQQFRQLPPEQRARLHAAFERFQQLPPEQRDRLMRQWDAIPPGQRMKWSEHQGMPGGPPPDGRP
jgi:hypothetical protein